jgi:phosphatidylserine/phosphatidylglycerophosphate/cardiolipin synthase-like enzyme
MCLYARQLIDSIPRVEISAPNKLVRGSLIGSINFDPRSFALNAEYGVVIVSRSLAADRMRSFEMDLERAIRVTPATVASFGIANRAVDVLAYWARAQL